MVRALEGGAELAAARYRLLAPIASGAMGSVWRAHDHQLERDVAIKRLDDPRFATRFEIEARLLSRLDHPRVVSVLDHFKDNSGNFLVMTLVEGVDLARHVRNDGRPGLPVEEAVGHMREACEALAYIHGEHVIHRDVKPHNLILAPDGVVLVDFGIAKALEPHEPATVGIGTLSFMAPEVLSGGRASPRSDVYGIAATLWMLVTGRPPRYGQETPLSSLASGVDLAVDRAVRRGLALDPNQRHPSAAAFAEALGEDLPEPGGASLAHSVEGPASARRLLEAVARAAAGIFEAAATSLAFLDRATGDLVYQVAWGAGGAAVLGLRLPRGQGIGGAVAEHGQGIAVEDCRADPRFAAAMAEATGYVPQTMLAVPLHGAHRTLGVLTLLDRRDGLPYGPADIPRADLFAELAALAIEIPEEFGTAIGEDHAGPP